MKSRLIEESEMIFGEYNINDLFEIEKSNLYAQMGSGIKTVEFILKHNNNIIFLEAKKSCPNEMNMHETKEKEKNFNKYYNDITEKFIDSFQIYLASFLKKYQYTAEIGDNLLCMDNLNGMNIKFILVIKTANDISWLTRPMAILKDRLIKYRKIWGIDIIVLNEELARRYDLIV